MDRKGEPQTLKQQSELRLYTDHPLKPFSQNFPNLWFLIIWRLSSDQFPKSTKWNHIKSNNVYGGKNLAKCWRCLFAYFMHRNNSIRILSCCCCPTFNLQLIDIFDLWVVMTDQNKGIFVFRFDYDSSFHRIVFER